MVFIHIDLKLVRGEFEVLYPLLNQHHYCKEFILLLKYLMFELGRDQIQE